MDPNKKAPAGTLPGDLGLTEGQMKQAARAVEEELAEPAMSRRTLLESLQTMLTDEDQTPVQAIVAEIQEQYTDAFHGIAIRAFAAGMKASAKKIGPDSGSGTPD